MRRIVLAALAVLLLHAAPTMAAECTNLALPANGGTASVSSLYTSAYTATTINNGRREDPNANTYYWIDGTRDTYPDWAQIEWSSARTLDQIVVRGPAPVGSGWMGGFPAEERTIGRARVQYWDSASSSWIDVVGNSEQSNPITNWVLPFSVPDGREIKQFDLATPVTTTKIRTLIEQSSSIGYSFLDEIEAYDRADCDPPIGECSAARALPGIASASSTHGSGLYPVSGVNNGRRESGDSKGYWNDDTNGVWPDWVQIAFDAPRAIGRVSARIPLAREEFPLGEITLRRTRIQYWDDATSTWTDVVGRTGQSNPIIDWSGPREVYDGSETRSFDLATPVTTTKIRALIEDGSTDGWSWLDELEAFSADCVTTPRDTNIALPTAGGTAFASSAYSGWYAYYVNDGRRPTGPLSNYWNSGPARVPRPHWVGVGWTSPRTLNRVVLYGPYLSSTSVIDRTLDNVLLQWWDDSASLWRDAASTQPNPLVNWVIPNPLDGREIRQFDFPAVSTSRVRILIDISPRDNWAYLDEFEAYWAS